MIGYCIAFGILLESSIQQKSDARPRTLDLGLKGPQGQNWRLGKALEKRWTPGNDVKGDHPWHFGNHSDLWSTGECPTHRVDGSDRSDSSKLQQP